MDAGTSATDFEKIEMNTTQCQQQCSKTKLYKTFDSKSRFYPFEIWNVHVFCVTWINTDVMFQLFLKQFFLNQNMLRTLKNRTATSKKTSTKNITVTNSIHFKYFKNDRTTQKDTTYLLPYFMVQNNLKNFSKWLTFCCPKCYATFQNFLFSISFVF